MGLHSAAGQAPGEAPCVLRGTLASRRSTVAVFGSGAALSLTGIASGSVPASSSHRVVVPGGGFPYLPGQRLRAAVFQPIGVAIFAMSGLWLGIGRAIPSDTLWFFIIGLPVLLAGTWLGLKLYGHLDEAGFRKVVLVLLLVSGIALVVPAIAQLFG